MRERRKVCSIGMSRYNREEVDCLLLSDRLSEQNIESILAELETLYRNHSRNGMSSLNLCQAAELMANDRRCHHRSYRPHYSNDF